MGKLKTRLAQRLAYVTGGMHPEIVTGLEQLDAEKLAARLASLKEQSGRVCFLISTTFADTLDAAGHNHNRTIEPSGWWHAAIRRYFPKAVLFKGPQPDTCLVFSWKPNVLAWLIVGHERRRFSLRRRLERLRSTRLQRRRPPGNVTETGIFALLRGKSVALVGNSRALAERSHGAEIDAHDVVVRCNRAPILNARSHGGRTDWIATSAEIPESLIEAKGAALVLWMSPRRDCMPLWLVGFPHLFVNPADSNRRLAALTGARPSTGMMVIDLLMRSECRRIDLYGFDFFKSQSTSGSQTKASTPHDFDSEEVLVRTWAETDARLVVHA